MDLDGEPLDLQGTAFSTLRLGMLGVAIPACRGLLWFGLPPLSDDCPPCREEPLAGGPAANLGDASPGLLSDWPHRALRAGTSLLSDAAMDEPEPLEATGCCVLGEAWPLGCGRKLEGLELPAAVPKEVGDWRGGVGAPIPEEPPILPLLVNLARGVM